MKLMGLTVVTRNGAVVGEEGVKKLTSALPFVSWNPFPVDVWRGDDDSVRVPRLKKPKESSLTACSNSNRFVPLVRRMTEKTKTLLNAGAFLHWFERHGCDGAQIRQAADDLETVLRNYEDL